MMGNLYNDYVHILMVGASPLSVAYRTNRETSAGQYPSERCQRP